MSLDEAPRGSAAPPSTPPPPTSTPPAGRRKQDTLAEIVPQGPWEDGWRPANTDFSQKATSWRAWHALSRTERHKGELAEFRAALEELRETIGAGLKFLANLRKLLLWAAAILGAAALVGGGAMVWHWLSTLHH
jgi:hypothetical protein